MAAEETKQPTAEQVQAYLQAGGGQCLFCGHDQIEGDSFDYEGSEVSQRVRCLKCGRSWYNVHVLRRVEVVE